MRKVKFLEGKKIYLRPVERQDLGGDYFRWINDVANDEFTEHAQFPHSLDELERFAQSKWRDSSCIWLAIIEKKSNRHIGNLEIARIDYTHRRAGFKIIIDRLHHGKGYGTEATKLILRHTFKTLNLHRVYLSVNESNAKARFLYKKLGFKQEGIAREGLLRDGKWKNIIMMGLLSKEFKS